MIVSQSEFFWDLRWGGFDLEITSFKIYIYYKLLSPSASTRNTPLFHSNWRWDPHHYVSNFGWTNERENCRSTMRPNLKPMISTSYSKVDPLGLPPSWWECNIISQESRMLISHKMILFCWGRIFLRSESLDKVCIYATVYALIFLNNFVIDSPRYVCNRRSIFCFISNIHDGFL